MDWIVYVVIFVLVVIFVRRLLPSPKNLGAATNALLAEHYLQSIELVPENPFTTELGNGIVNVFRLSGFPNIDDSAVFEKFNNSNRFVQLLLIAMALNEFGNQPKLQNEFWHPVKNPFATNLENSSHVDAVKGRLLSTHDADVHISENKLHLDEKGLVGN